MPERFAQAIERIAALNPDLLVLSGDLIDYPLGSPQQMADPTLQAQARLDLELIAELLARLDCPQALVYGNHEHPALFREVFGHVSSDQTVAGYRVLSFWDEEGEGNVPQRTGAERRRFDDALADASSLSQVHVQHYPVWPECSQDYPYTYGNGAQMRDAIVDSGRVRLVLSGHYHDGVAPFVERGVTFATIPAFCVAPHPFWVYDLADDGVTCTSHTLVA